MVLLRVPTAGIPISAMGSRLRGLSLLSPELELTSVIGKLNCSELRSKQSVLRLQNMISGT